MAVLRISAQAEIREDDTNDDDEAYDVNDGVHECSFSFFSMVIRKMPFNAHAGRTLRL